MAFIEDSAPQKNAGKQFKQEIFLRHRLLQTPGGENTRRKKDDPSPAIGEKILNQKRFFFLV